MNKMENRRASKIKNIITDGMADEHDIETMRKVMLTYTIGIAGVSLLIPLGILAFIEGNFSLGLFDHFTSLVLILNLLYLRRGGNYQFACVFCVTAGGILFFFLLATGGVNNTAHVWYY